ncbi:MAG: hypothetical protein SVU88_01785 [Candidatus Nanohaloarchaea archaeon]|nr:hypothetical protein [Candidatus Nanohaloarchaea archaeon]
MRKTAALSAASVSFLGAASASHPDRAAEPQWGFLIGSAVLLGGLALYIYLRVQGSGFLTFLPQTAAEKLDIEPEGDAV